MFVTVATQEQEINFADMHPLKKITPVCLRVVCIVFALCSSVYNIVRTAFLFRLQTPHSVLQAPYTVDALRFCGQK
jgi:hypothetical protein